ncbi:amino acid ABC transporter permease [Lonepinella sp. BR2357]|uniref:amino acid ABC transporter permease n=1 Tax=Lonepinella sp. BR2357 TaxID=3434549 RepID=UPI003F6DBD41
MEVDYEFLYRTFFTIWQGAGVTLSLTVLSLLIAFVPALYMAVVRLGGGKIGAKLVSVYVSFIRGTPIILQILLIYSLLPSFLNAWLKQMGSNFNIFDAIDPFWYAVVVFSLNTTALLSEIFRAAFFAISKDQLEAGIAVGLSRFQTYTRVIIPQALVIAMPALANLTLNLIKGTSLAFLMTVKDITAIGRIEASYGYNYVEAYFDVFLVYIIICSIVQFSFNSVEKHLGRYRNI